MPALKKTDITGRLTFIGRVSEGLRSESVTQAELGFEGIAGECHSGLTRPSCSRVTTQYPRGTEIRNTRQLSVVSAEELAQIAAKMEIASLDPRLIGASLVISGIPDFSHLPPSSRLQFSSGATITIDMQNRPCILPGREIEIEAPGYGNRFKSAAKGLRGVTAWAERPGPLKIGDTVTLHIPDQRAWQPGPLS